MKNPERGNIASGASDHKATKELVESKYLYNPETGFFHRKLNGGRLKKSPSGALNSTGYRQISVNGVLHSAHRLAWFVMTGEWPIADVDHRNGNRDDNRWENLREVNRSLNMENQRRAHRCNATGFLGVSYHKDISKFAASIVVQRKKIHIGYFSEAAEAHAAYIKKKKELHKGSTI